MSMICNTSDPLAAMSDCYDRPGRTVGAGYDRPEVAHVYTGATRAFLLNLLTAEQLDEQPHEQLDEQPDENTDELPTLDDRPRHALDPWETELFAETDAEVAAQADAQVDAVTAVYLEQHRADRAAEDALTLEENLEEDTRQLAAMEIVSDETLRQRAAAAEAAVAAGLAAWLRQRQLAATAHNNNMAAMHTRALRSRGPLGGPAGGEDVPAVADAQQRFETACDPVEEPEDLLDLFERPFKRARTDDF